MPRRKTHGHATIRPNILAMSRACFASLGFAAWLTSFALPAAGAAPGGAPAAPAPVSFYKQVRPILQSSCYGCHQPAKDKGSYVMTDFAKLLAGGDSGDAAIVAGQPDKSALIEQITPKKGEPSADMPKGKPALAASDIDLIRRWIAEGAHDDAPENTRARFDAEHPPVYTSPPVITAIDFSPDGRLLAIGGFHEVLLFRADGSERVARLVGLSERIQSLRFSPDGKQLAVTGGLPGRAGEVQIWDVATRKLAVSVPVTFDTIFGVSWSPDSTKIAFGCSDNSVRAIDAKTGEQILFQGVHSDWVLGTAFSTTGSHVISVGRDGTSKLIELATQRFVDNITSITPGALKGGIAAVARHPVRDEIVVGGADGVPKVYRIFRETERRIGDDANLVRTLPVMRGRISNVAVSRDGRRIAAVSSLDGKGEVQVFSYEFDTGLTDKLKQAMAGRNGQRTAEQKALLAAYAVAGVKSLWRTPIEGAVVYGVAFRPDGRVLASAGSNGTVRLIDATTGVLIKALQPAPVAPKETQVASAALTAGLPGTMPTSFIADVNPVMSRLGCNQGTCHGSAQGKNGFKLSLRGYDPVEDVRALTDDLGSRRVNIASPDDSLMLLKATGSVPHVGGQLVSPGDGYYQIMRGWIADGAKLNLDTPRVASIAVTPTNPVIESLKGRQQMRVIATYSNGKTKDVTREAFLESSNTEVATTDRSAVMTAIRRGEASVLARFEGAYAATTLTVMGDRKGFVWQPPPVNNRIDELAAEKWRRMKMLPSGLSTDTEFIRRVTLDLAGLPPTADEVRAFVADPRSTREKRDALINGLVGSEAFVEYWTNKWSDLLQVNRKFLGAEGATAFRSWIRNEVANNTPYDQFVRKILTASGSNRDNPPASYYKILREPEALMENTTHLFLAVRFNCNKCHDHPFERWTQNQYYETAAFFAQVGRRGDPTTLGQKIGGTAVESAKPLYEVIYDRNKGDVVHLRTQQAVKPTFPFAATFAAPEKTTPREQLAAWMVAPDNAYFARSYVNRLWGYLLGRGIIEPIDDIRAGNPPTNPALLDYLTKEFVDSGFDVRRMFRLITKSRTYQLSISTNKWNEDDRINYSHATARRLPAEVIYDAVHQVTGSLSRFPDLEPGTRAVTTVDAMVDHPSGFLSTFGRPVRESACECERSSELRLGAIMSLVSGPTVAEAISDPQNAIASLVSREADDNKLINELFLRILNRPATPQEVKAALASMHTADNDDRQLADALATRECELTPSRNLHQKERDAAIAKARGALAAHEKQIGPARAEQERKRDQAIAQTEALLREYEETMPQKLAAWERKQNLTADWVRLVPRELEATGSASLTIENDLSISVSAGRDRGSYTFTTETDLRGVTGIRLEALADTRLPEGGPGRGERGEFELTGIEVKIAPRATPKRTTVIALANPRADFMGPGSDLGSIIKPPEKKKPGAPADKTGASKGTGWTIGSATGVTHWATFEAKAPFGFAGGTVVTITLRHDSEVTPPPTLGRFRLSLTTAKRPVGLGLSDELRAILSRVEDGFRSGPLNKYFNAIDVELQARLQAFATAMKPVPVDPALQALRDQLAKVSQPLAEDPALVQLRSDKVASKEQRHNQRLTLAQDLAWALISSPAFLFNR